jgi:hypothetical protein
MPADNKGSFHGCKDLETVPKIRYHMAMSITPIPPEKELDEETKRILQERDLTFEDDRKTAVDARQAISNIRRKLEKLQPR